MTPEEAKRGDGKAFKALVIKERAVRYLHPDYKFEFYPGAEIDESNGLLEIGRIITTIPGLPWFCLRWDNGRRSGEQVDQFDVDIKGVSKEIEDKFRAEKDDHRGHHPRKVSTPDGKRILTVFIQIPGKKIFDGEIEVSVHKKLGEEVSPTSDIKIAKFAIAKEISIRIGG